MKKNTEKNRVSRRGRRFYFTAIVIFASLIVLALGSCIVQGITDERIVIILMNAWFMLFTMDIVTTRFRRKGEQAFWHNWVFFRNKQQDTQPETIEYLDDDNSKDIKKSA